MGKANIPDPFDPIYLRRAKGGEGFSGIKFMPWFELKVDRPNTNLFDDLVFAKSRLDAFADYVSHCAETLLTIPFEFGAEFTGAHPFAGEDEILRLAKQIRSEAEWVPRIWRLIRINEYNPPQNIKRHYTYEQLKWQPELDPEKVNPIHYGFMSAKDQNYFDYLQKMNVRKTAPSIPASWGQTIPGVIDDDDDDIELDEFDDDE